MLKREVLRKQARNMVYQVYTYMAKEAEQGCCNVKQIQRRTSNATQTCTTTVRRIVKDKANDSKLKTPGKKRIGRKRVTGFDNYKLGLMKRFIHTYHLTFDEYPTLGKLKHKLQSTFNFKGSYSSLRKILFKMGFHWKRTEDKNRILVEHSHVRLKRIEYLKQLKKYHQEGRTVVFTDELYLERAREQKMISKSQCVTVIHAASESSFIPDALLVCKSQDAHSNISGEFYLDWLENQLIPNLPPQSVVVVDTSPPHNMEYDPAPNYNARKCDMQAWLDNKKIQYEPDMYKPQLFQLIKDNKDSFKQLTLDKLLTDNGHDILRLPPFHSDLNPIEMVWTAIRTHASDNCKDFDVHKVIDLVKEKMNAISPEDWKKMCAEVKEIEDIYRKNERIIDTVSDNILISNMESSSESENSDSSTSFDENNVLPMVFS